MKKRYAIKKKLLVISSPSGGGKTTVTNYILSKYPMIKFSISATTRPKRPREKNGVHYHFISREQFEEKIKNNELIEYEYIFGNYYGTPKSEIEKAFKNDIVLIFDIDVKGALSIKKAYPEESFLVFIEPPSIQTLKERLKNRRSESEEQINERLSRVEMELKLKEQFDYIIKNEMLSDTFNEIDSLISKYIIEPEDN